MITCCLVTVWECIHRNQTGPRHAKQR